MVSFNLNVFNAILIGFGTTSIIFPRRLLPIPGWWKAMNQILGVGELALGLADAFGVIPLTEKLFGEPAKPIFSWSSGYAGAYQVAAKNLPYDPNNYYLPPRDRSIAP